jgi:hypothetical protein
VLSRGQSQILGSSIARCVINDDHLQPGPLSVGKQTLQTDPIELEVAIGNDDH